MLFPINFRNTHPVKGPLNLQRLNVHAKACVDQEGGVGEGTGCPHLP